jgi:serine/threonine protein kinase
MTNTEPKLFDVEFAIKMNDGKLFDINQFEKGKKLGKGSFHNVYSLPKKGEVKYNYVLRVAKNISNKNNLAKIYHSYLLQILITEKILYDEQSSIPQEVKAGNFLPKTYAFGKLIGGENNYFVVMEAIPEEKGVSGDLFSFVGEDPNVDKLFNDTDLDLYKRRMRIIFKIVKGLEILKSIYIFHNDLKLENIMYNFVEDKITIVDFDMAKMDFRMVDEDVVQDKFLYKLQEGTLEYFAPEKWENKPYNYKVDVWALGNIIEAINTGDLSIYSDLIPSSNSTEHPSEFYPVCTQYSKGNINTICNVNMRLTNDLSLKRILKNIINNNNIQKLPDIIRSEVEKNINELLVNVWVLNPSKRYSYLKILEYMSSITYINEEKNQKNKDLKEKEYLEYLKFINYDYFYQKNNQAFDELREYIKHKYQNATFDGDIIAYYVCKLNNIYKINRDKSVHKKQFEEYDSLYRVLHGIDNNQIVDTNQSKKKKIVYKCNLNEDGSLKKLPALDLLYKLNDVKHTPVGIQNKSRFLSRIINTVAGGSRNNKKQNQKMTKRRKTK